ncbi:MAG: DUF2927 domain-containing protein [Pseudomonadota bacterium]
MIKPSLLTRCFALVVVFWLGVLGSAHAFSDQSVLKGFNRTVFGSEFAGFGLQANYVRRFERTVRFYIHHTSRKNRRPAVRRFIRSLRSSIRGLRTQIVTNPRSANFHVYIVDRSQYGKTIRDQIYRSRSAPVRGRCMVRARFTRGGITRSDAVIVSDEGESLFRRCLVEEILQGLGPLNEHSSLTASVFNDASTHTSFTRFDRLILNMLYDKRVRSGDSPRKVQPLLPALLKTAKRRVR